MKLWMVIAIFMVAMFLWVSGIFSAVKGTKAILNQTVSRIGVIEEVLK